MYFQEIAVARPDYHRASRFLTPAAILYLVNVYVYVNSKALCKQMLMQQCDGDSFATVTLLFKR